MHDIDNRFSLDTCKVLFGAPELENILSDSELEKVVQLWQQNEVPLFGATTKEEQATNDDYVTKFKRENMYRNSEGRVGVILPKQADGRIVYKQSHWRTQDPKNHPAD